MRRAPGILLAGSLLLAACGGAAPAKKPAPAAAPATQAAYPAAVSKPATPTKTQASFTFSVDGPFVGWYAPFFVAKQRGYYKQAGINVTRIVQGKGSVTTAELVANGHYPIAMVDAAAAATAITKGMPIKVVAVYFQKSPLAVIYLKSRPLSTPAALIGKTIAAAPGSTSAELLPAFLSANHINPSQVKVAGASSITASVTALAQHKVDGVVNFGNFAIPIMAAKGLKLGQLLWADHGLPLMSESLVTSDAYLKQHPAVVKGFVQATTKAFQYTVAHPNAAVKIMQAGVGSKIPAGAGEIRLSVPLLHSALTQGHPMGWMSSQAWKQMLAVLQKYQKLGSLKPLSAYYTNAFIGG